MNKLRKDYAFVTIEELIIMFMNARLGQQDPEVGWEDTTRPLDKLLYKLDRTVKIKKTDLEKLLSSCNYMGEKQKFWHHRGKDSRYFIDKITGYNGLEYDYDYNFFKEED